MDNITNIDIDNDVEIATEGAIEEREQEIVARYTAQSKIVESEDEEELNPVPIPQNAVVRKMPNQLCISLETKGFQSMEEFDTFAGQITVQFLLDKYCSLINCQRCTVTSVKR